ncbi:MAG: hypothetical protein GY940_26830 [bacterium]|nr:hypothetical protein [bacterium]
MNNTLDLHTQVTDEFKKLKNKYSNIYVVVSPPRCSSTAFTRMFWEQPSIRYYSHEPFEVTYYWEQPVEAVIEKIENPLDLQPVKNNPGHPQGNGLIIKEMPYQVWNNFPLLLAIATPPVIFMIRDPRLNISSRMAKKQETGNSPFFPLMESGWELIASQIDLCKDLKIPYVIVESRDFRNHPEELFSQLFARFDLPFTSNMLSWKAAGGISLDNLEGEHDHLYDQVLDSTGIHPTVTPPPDINSFPENRGMRAHVMECMEVYEMLYSSPERIRVSV